MKTMPRVVLLIDTQRDFGRGLVQGITQYAQFHGPWSFLHEPVSADLVLQRLQNERVDAIVMMAFEANLVQVAARLTEAVVVVVVEDVIEGFHNVAGDYLTDGVMGADYLLNRGFRQFAFSGVPRRWSDDRCRGFRERVEAAGFEVNVLSPPPESGGSWMAEQQAMVDWLAELPKPVALMACNDEQGRRILEACKIAEVKVPTEVAVLGVDNDEMVCRLTQPQLSSIAVNTQRAGYEIGELLEKLLRGEPLAPRKIVIQATNVVTRQSTDVMAIEDADVAAALDFIYHHRREPIQVANVCQVVTVTRRTLERKFQHHLGRSVNQEIRRARVDLACQMLLNTNHSILHIARSLGFTGCEHIARYFRKEKGMSLIEYRRKFGAK